MGDIHLRSDHCCSLAPSALQWSISPSSFQFFGQMEWQMEWWFPGGQVARGSQRVERLMKRSPYFSSEEQGARRDLWGYTREAFTEVLLANTPPYWISVRDELRFTCKVARSGSSSRGRWQNAAVKLDSFQQPSENIQKYLHPVRAICRVHLVCRPHSLQLWKIAHAFVIGDEVEAEDPPTFLWREKVICFI